MQKIDRHKHLSLNRRSALLLGGQASLVALLGVRLFHLQVMEHEQYKDMATDNSVNYALHMPKRGLITDVKGRLLVDNQASYSLKLVPEETQEHKIKDILQRLSSIIPLTPEEIEAFSILAKKQRSFIPLIIKEELEWESLAAISLHLYQFPGLKIEEQPKRFYPMASLVASVTGYVGRVTQKEQNQSQHKILYKMPDFRIGKQGIERQYETRLQGR